MSNLTTTVLYNNPSNFTFDSNKIEVTASRAQLKLINNILLESASEDFSDDTGFTYDNTKVEFVAGSLQQKNQRPPNATSGCNFDTKDLNWSDGSLTGTLGAGTVIAGNKLVKTAATHMVKYTGAAVISANEGCIRFRFIPNFNGSYGGTAYMMSSSGAMGFNLLMQSNGSLRFTMKNDVGTGCIDMATGGISWVLGQSYELEFNWNISAQIGNLYINANRMVNELNFNGVRTIPNTDFYFGSWITSSVGIINCSMTDLIIFDTLQNDQPTRTTGYVVPALEYAASVVDLPVINYGGLGTIQSIDSVTKTGTDTPNHTNTVGPNTIGVQLQFAAGTTPQDIDQLDVSYEGQIYPSDNPSLTINAPFTMTDLTEMAAVENKSGLDEIKYQMKFQGVYYYMVGDVVTVSDGSYLQSSSLADIQASLLNGPIDINPDAAVQLVVLLHSEDGSTTPDTESVTLGYNYYVTTTDPATCIVFGSVYDNSGNAVAGAKVTIDSDDYFYAENLIALRSVGYTNAAGTFSLKAVETATVVKTVNVTIEYTQDGKKKKAKYTGITIPNQATAALSTLIP